MGAEFMPSLVPVKRHMQNSVSRTQNKMTGMFSAFSSVMVESSLARCQANYARPRRRKRSANKGILANGLPESPEAQVSRCGRRTMSCGFQPVW
jgi:hypothetical protein